MRNVKLHELGKASKPIERFLINHTALYSSELEQIICKLCDLKDVEISFLANETTIENDLRQSVECNQIGNIIFSASKQSVESLLCMHLKVENTYELSKLKLTNTHARLFNKVCIQIAKILMGDHVELSNVDAVTSSEQSISMRVLHKNVELAMINLILDTRYLSYIRDQLETFPALEPKRIENALQQTPVELECEVMSATRSLQHMLDLRVGDFLPMKKLSQARLKVNGVEMYKGAVITTENALGVKVNEQIR